MIHIHYIQILLKQSARAMSHSATMGHSKSRTCFSSATHFRGIFVEVVEDKRKRKAERE